MRLPRFAKGNGKMGYFYLIIFRQLLNPGKSLLKTPPVMPVTFLSLNAGILKNTNIKLLKF